MKISRIVDKLSKLNKKIILLINDIIISLLVTYLAISLRIDTINIDIELLGTKIKPGEAWFKMYPNKEVNVSLLLEKSKIYNNLIEEFQMKLKIKK